MCEQYCYSMWTVITVPCLKQNAKKKKKKKEAENVDAQRRRAIQTAPIYIYIYIHKHTIFRGKNVVSIYDCLILNFSTKKIA